MTEQSLPKPETTPEKKPVPRQPLKVVLSAFGMLLLEILLSVVASGGLVYGLFLYFNLWQYEHTLATVVFAAAFVAFALMISLTLDALFAPARKRNRKLGAKTFTGPISRLIKLALAGIILPIAIFTLANLVHIPDRGTLMNLIETSSRAPVKLAPPDEVGRVALETKNPTTRLLSIRVLEGFHSPEALAQLLKLAENGSDVLANPSVAAALQQAIAAYGVSARDPLIVMFQRAAPTSDTQPVNTSSDLYDRYFDSSFASLKAEVERNTLDPAARAAQIKKLEAAQEQLKQSLDELPSIAAQTGGDPRQSFVMQTFLAMNVKEDKDLLAFARMTAADQKTSSLVRGDALLLVAKLGGKSDLDSLYPYLANQDEFIQARALQAIAALQSKLSGTSSSEPTP